MGSLLVSYTVAKERADKIALRKISHSGFEGEGGEHKGMNVLVLAIA